MNAFVARMKSGTRPTITTGPGFHPGYNKVKP